MTEDLTHGPRRRRPDPGDADGSGTGPAPDRLALARAALAQAEAIAAEGSRDPEAPPRLRALDGGTPDVHGVRARAEQAPDHPASRAVRSNRPSLRVVETGGETTGAGRSEGGADAGRIERIDPEAVTQARSVAAKALTAAPRTRAELLTRMREKGSSIEVAELVAAECERQGLIDDVEYARMFVESRRRTKGLGRHGLAQELRAKGVDRDVVDDALADIEDEDESEQARDLVRRRLGSVSGLPRETQVRRLAGVLARRGYPSGVAMQVIAEELGAAEDA